MILELTRFRQEHAEVDAARCGGDGVPRLTNPAEFGQLPASAASQRRTRQTNDTTTIA